MRDDPKLLLAFFLFETINMFCLNGLNYELGVQERSICRFFFLVSKNTIFSRFDVFVPCFREGVQIYYAFSFGSTGAVQRS